LSKEFEFGGITDKLSSTSLWESVSSDKSGIDGLKFTAGTDLCSAMLNDKVELEVEDSDVLFSERLH
jgi:hypothetical protein